MGRKKQASKPFDGGFDVKAMVDALSTIEEERSITQEETLEILRQAFEKAYKDWTDPVNSDDLLAEAVLDLEKGRIHIYEVKNVVEEVEDDLIQVEVEEAQKVDPELKAGDQLKTEVDLAVIAFETSFVRKVANIFKQKMIEANKATLLAKFNSQIGTIISGEVEKVDHDSFVILSFGHTTACLNNKNIIPGEKFTLGQMVKVYLEGVGEKSKNPQLLITRTNDKFLMKLFEEEVHDVYDGTVVIKKVAREPGIRSKVAVYTSNPNVDPTGACIGPDGNRIRNICAQLSGEKIDVIKYMDNQALFIAEALKPATVVGVRIEGNGTNRAVAVVKNSESKVAIGKRGVNVRLASHLVGLSIDVKELDAAMGERISYRTIEDIKREESMANLTRAEEVFTEYNDDEVEDFDLSVDTPEVVTSKEETVVPEETVAAVAVEEKPVAVPQEEKIIITAKPKVSLAELEKQIEEEKRRKGKETPNTKKKFTRPSKPAPSYAEPEEEIVSKPIEPVVSTMPIYTEEELKAMEEEEDRDEIDPSVYEDFDDDDFYDGDDSNKGTWHY